MKKLYFLLLIFFPFLINAQSSDFILLKKGKKTITAYYAGTNIEFVTIRGVYKNAFIYKIKHDSIFIQEFLINQQMTKFGFYILDTVGSFRFNYNYRDIKTIGKTKDKFDVRASGASLLGGGVLLTLASGIVYIADRKKFSPQLMEAGAGLGLLGYFLGKKSNQGIIIGKRKYRFEYINMEK